MRLHTGTANWTIALAIISLTGIFAKPISAQKPLFDGVVDGQSGQYQVNVRAPIAGATDLYLVANDGGNGNSFDWADWLNPSLSNGEVSVALTDLDWEIATSDFGEVRKNQNCFAGPLVVGSTTYKNGIGTHASSIIHFRLPENHGFTIFSAIAGLDIGGVSQKGGRVAKVRFMVFTERPNPIFTGGKAMVSDHSIGSAVGQFEVHDDLDVSLFAHEPMLVNPSNMDVDHLGRIWVCEIVNYRNKIRNADSQERRLGDRILIIEDENGDGFADSSSVFYQGRDIDSAHGICVLGDRVIVSAGSEVFYLIDTDGDSKADKKEVLFTGIGGVQHDHGIHAFVFGPDGKLYFNFGNEGRQICDAAGRPIVDMAGNVVNDQRKPYQEGMVFRCNLDGSEFETLAWNFRNNWEVCVDSFGGMWQSDNDDDGNRSTRINYVLPFGNYGYRDELTGAGWREHRSGKSTKVTEQHWHHNDPGVVPNLLDTGAGSPTGICVYEGSLLPEIFHGQLIHCDAGPNIVRSYIVKPSRDSAGFDVETVSVLDGAEKNQWFRPSDVCVAPDGSLIVADWYDPGVGGHRMQDVQRGRLFRVTPESHNGYRCNSPDFESVGGCLTALRSPNLATRYLAYQSLVEIGTAAIPALLSMTQTGELHHRARAFWVLDAIQQNESINEVAMLNAWKTEIPELQMMALRWWRQQTNQERAQELWDSIDIDSIESPHVLRELAVSLSPNVRQKLTTRVDDWMGVARKFKGGDRWLLEALGIGAAGIWDGCVERLISPEFVQGQDVAQRELLWRSRCVGTLPCMQQLICFSDLPIAETVSYFRAMDFIDSPFKSQISKTIVDLHRQKTGERSRIVTFEALKRTNDVPVDWQDQVFERFAGTPEFVELVDRFKLESRFNDLLEFAVGKSTQLAVDSIRVLAKHDRIAVLDKWLVSVSDPDLESLLKTLAICRIGEIAGPLNEYARNNGNSIERRRLVVSAMSKIKGCSEFLMQWVSANQHDKKLEPAIAAALHASNWPTHKMFARQRFPLKTAGDTSGAKDLLLDIHQLAEMQGDAIRGMLVFAKDGICSKCHVVQGVGNEVGPDLTEIGSKLSRSAMYESILFPSAGISHNYETWLVLTVDGTVVNGLKVSETDKEFQIRDAENVLHKIAMDDVDQIKQLDLSLMPADLIESMTQQQLIDLVEYLLTLKKE